MENRVQPVGALAGNVSARRPRRLHPTHAQALRRYCFVPAMQTALPVRHVDLEEVLLGNVFLFHRFVGQIISKLQIRSARNKRDTHYENTKIHCRSIPLQINWVLYNGNLLWGDSGRVGRSCSGIHQLSVGTSASLGEKASERMPTRRDSGVSYRPLGTPEPFQPCFREIYQDLYTRL